MVGEVCLSVAAASTWPFAPFCKAAQEGARKKKEKKSKRGLKKKENVRRKTCLSAAAFVVTRRFQHKKKSGPVRSNVHACTPPIPLTH